MTTSTERSTSAAGIPGGRGVNPAPGTRPARTAQSAALQKQGLNLRDAWHSLRKHWATALGMAVATAGLVTFYTLGQTKIYETTATLLLDPNPPRPLGKGVETVVEMGSGNYWSNREFYLTHYRLIQSPRVALAVVKALDLHRDAGFIANAAPGAKVAAVNVTPERAAELFQTRLSVAPVKDSRLATVRFTDADPERAQRILAKLIDTYLEQNLEDATATSANAAEWLGDQADKLKKGLESNELSLHRYKIDKNILSVDLDAQSNMLREEMRQLNDALTTVRTKREEVAAKRNALATVPVDNPGELPANELLHSVLLQSLRQRYEDAQRDREALLGAGRGANHPTVTAAQARVEGSRKALIAEVKNIQAAADRELTAVSAHAGGIAGLYARAKAQAFELNLLEIEYNKLRRERDNTAKLYQLVLERSKESDLARLLQVNNVRIIDRPQRPVDAIYPRTLMNIAGGILLGLLLGIGAAIMRALFDRTLKTPDDVEHELGVAFLGLIPEIDEAKKATRTGSRKGRRKKSQQGTSRELIVHALSRSRIAEAARAVRTNLMFMSPDRPYKTILITSAGPAEGKTTVACCVAIAMAQAGQRVLLIDCDLRRPRIHRVFGKQSDTGVTTLLVGDGELCEDELKTDIPNLSVLSAGPIPPTPSELFLSNRFKALLESATEKYDRVIIDSPPVAVVTDAAILSTLVDGTVMVVRAFATTKDVARHGARALADVGGNTVGVVLNAVDVSRQGYQYYHYVYYAYDRRGYYEGYGEPPNSSRSSSSSEGAGLAH